MSLCMYPRDSSNSRSMSAYVVAMPRIVIDDACYVHPVFVVDQRMNNKRNVYTLRYNIESWLMPSNSIWMQRTEVISLLTRCRQTSLRSELVADEERYRSVGLTDHGRLLSAVWTIRDGKIRAITAFRATIADRKAFLENTK